MPPLRREQAENAALRQFQSDCSEIVNDVTRVLDDPGENTTYTGYFHAFPPWTKVDLSNGDVSFSKKLSEELQNFQSDFLSQIKFDVATYRDQRCVFFHFPSKNAFNFFVNNCSIPLQRLYGKAPFDGAWTRMECLNIVEWFNFPESLGQDQIKKLGDLRKTLSKHFLSFLNDIRVINVNRNSAFLRIEFSRDITSEELDKIRANQFIKGEKVSVSGLWFNKHYQCRHCASTSHHHNNCPRAKAIYQIVHTNRVYKPEDLGTVAKLVGANSCVIGIPFDPIQKSSGKAITFIYNSKKALLDRKDINLSFVRRRCPPNGPYGSQVVYLSDLDSYCGRCSWRKNSRSCHCNEISMHREGAKLLDFIEKYDAPARKSDKAAPEAAPSQNADQKPAPAPKASLPAQQQKPPEGPPARKSPAPPAFKDPIIKEAVPDLKDIRTPEELKAYVKFHGAEYKRGLITDDVTKAFLSDIEKHSKWESFQNRSEAVFGDTINFPGIGFSYGTPLKFRKADYWKSSIAQAASDIAVGFGDIMPPNLGAVQSYQAGDACARHKDREKECREEGYTVIVAIGGPRIFKFANRLKKGDGYVECSFHMADGDVMYIPKCLNYGKHSVYHYKDKTNSPHFSLVLKHAKAPSMF